MYLEADWDCDSSEGYCGYCCLYYAQVESGGSDLHSQTPASGPVTLDAVPPSLSASQNKKQGALCATLLLCEIQVKSAS